MGGQISQCLAAEHRESKVVNRLVSYERIRFVQHVGKVQEVKTFPDGGGLYAEVASRFTPSNKVVKQLAQT